MKALFHGPQGVMKEVARLILVSLIVKKPVSPATAIQYRRISLAKTTGHALRMVKHYQIRMV